MAIFTADQATTAVAQYTLAQSQSSLDSLVAEYQQIFDTIRIASAAGSTSIDLKITKYDYNRVKYLLIDNGYTISTLPEDTILQDDRQVTYSMNIAWSATTVDTLVGISPSIFTVTVGVSSVVNLVPQGGRGPYTWIITAGSLPTGLAFGSLSRVTALVISGTAATQGTGSFNYTLTDTSGQSYSANVTWSVIANNTFFLGSTPVNLDRTSGAITLSDVSITGNAATVTDGVYVQGDQTIAGIKTFTSTIAGSITGNAGTVSNGVYTQGDQTIAGTKTFTSTITGSITGNAGTATNGVVTTGSYTDPSWLTITKSKVGLSNVDNSSTATILNNSALTGTTTIVQATLSTNGALATSLVNKSYIDSKIWLALAVGY